MQSLSSSSKNALDLGFGYLVTRLHQQGELSFSNKSLVHGVPTSSSQDCRVLQTTITAMNKRLRNCDSILVPCSTIEYEFLSTLNNQFYRIRS